MQTSALGVNTLVMINTLSVINAALATAKYQPNHNENDGMHTLLSVTF